jgi:hypothetical protein
LSLNEFKRLIEPGIQGRSMNLRYRCTVTEGSKVASASAAETLPVLSISALEYDWPNPRHFGSVMRLPVSVRQAGFCAAAELGFAFWVAQPNNAAPPRTTTAIRM